SKVTTDLSKVDLEKTLISLNETLANLQLASSKFNEKSNTVGLLLNDPSLYLNLNATMDSSNKLLIDLKENPKRYIHFSVFGAKKEKK
ncbi:MAG TPA: MCE family protein, partial [Paludibacteraceae bacterium]|nr:MCE family protein [Paludibacteraceae bacterium]